MMMSDLYKTPELRSYYCKHECPIGRNLPLATQVSGLQGITVKILNSLDEDGVRSMKKQLLSIAEDGEITADEQEEFDGIVKNWKFWQQKFRSYECWLRNSRSR